MPGFILKFDAKVDARVNTKVLIGCGSRLDVDNKVGASVSTPPITTIETAGL